MSYGVADAYVVEGRAVNTPRRTKQCCKGCNLTMRIEREQLCVPDVYTRNQTVDDYRL